MAERKINPSDIKNKIWQPLYDSIAVSESGGVAVAKDYEFFKQAIGSVEGSITKTKFHTNNSISGMIENDTRYEVVAISIGLYCPAVSGSGLTLADINALIFGNQAIFTFKIRDVIYLELPLYRFSAGYGVYGFTTNATTSIVANGMPDSRAIYSLRPRKITIKDNTPFACTIRQEAAATLSSAGLNLRWTVSLESIKTAPIYK